MLHGRRYTISNATINLEMLLLWQATGKLSFTLLFMY
jgi:hypothetical protein